MQLSKRLMAVASFVSRGSCVADIGCDHGFVPIYLINNGIAMKAIAMDVKKGPLERAEKHIQKWGLEEKIQIRQSDGMEKLLLGEVDTVIMAGMGGPLMIRILKEKTKVAASVREFILSPQSEIEGVRRYLIGSGFQIKREKMVLEDGKYYIVMKAIHGIERPYRLIDYRYGKLLLKQKDLVLASYLEREVNTISQLIKKLERDHTAHSQLRLEELREGRKIARQALEELRESEVHNNMQCGEIIEKLRELAPEYLACDWDNVGLLLGAREKEVNKILIGLEIDDSLIETAVKKQVDMIITHHPMLFHPVKNITGDHFIGRRILKILGHDISYYAMHTNFDSSAQGMAEIAAEKLGLQNRTVLEEEEVYVDVNGKKQMAGTGRMGQLKEGMCLEDFCKKVKEVFGNQMLTVYATKEQMKTEVSRVAIVPGAGKDFIEAAIQKKADVFITGDLNHHAGVDAMAQGLILIDAGHYCTEQIFMGFMAAYLNNCLEDSIKIVTMPVEQPFQII